MRLAESGAELPRWAGITEPMTVATNVVLAGLAFVLAVRLAFQAAGERSAAGGCIAAALSAAAFAALIGAVAHGTDPASGAARRARLWVGALYTTGFIGAACMASAAYFAARGITRTAILGLAVIKLVMYIVRVARHPDFRVAAADYGVALAIVVVAAAYMGLRRQAPGMGWLIFGGLVSLVAGIVQAGRFALHRHFNHNDLYHVIQMAGLYAFYRGGALLVDR